MWTCDIIKGMQAVETKMEYPVCIKRITSSIADFLIIETTGNVRYHYDIILEKFIGD